MESLNGIDLIAPGAAICRIVLLTLDTHKTF